MEIMNRVQDQIHKKSKIGVSAFGLGSDFDEVLMKGISEKGRGAYFFIEGAGAIPQFVEFALKFVLEMVGSDAVLHIRGKNGAVLSKIYGHYEGLEEGAWLGDMKANNVRSFLTEFEARGDIQDNGDVDILTYKLCYKKKGGVEEVIENDMKIRFTDNKDCIVYHPDVRVKVAVQLTAEIDKKLLKLMEEEDNEVLSDDSDDNNNNTDNDNTEKEKKFTKKQQKLIKLQEKQIKLFEDVVDIDEHELSGKNRIKSLLDQAKVSLEKIKRKESKKKMQKEVHHKVYMKSRG